MAALRPVRRPHVVPDSVAWAAGLVLVLGFATYSVLVGRRQLVVAAALGGIALDIWLYDLLDLGASAVLAVSLVLGLGVIALAIAAWRFRERFLALLPPPLRAWTAGLPV